MALTIATLAEATRAEISLQASRTGSTPMLKSGAGRGQAPGGTRPTGACCLFDGTCAVVTEEACLLTEGVYVGDGTACDGILCPLPGACCLPDGSCAEIDHVACTAAGGMFAGAEVPCDAILCPPPLGACCLPDGSCAETDEVLCAAVAGAYQGDLTACDVLACPPPTGACCLVDGSCSVIDDDACGAAGGSWNGPGVDCASIACAPAGACCLADGSCLLRTQAACDSAGGAWLGEGTTCDAQPCQPPPAPLVRGDVLEKGSVLLLPLVEVAWDPSGALVADTRFWVTNDYPAGVRVRAFFMNGDRPLDADGDERAHDGWNHVEFSFPLTANQPVQWSAALGHASLAPSWGQLDPGPPPGRPEPGTGRRVLRGSVLLIAVDAAGREIRWNHLAAGAMLVDYERGTAAEGHAISFRAVDESIVNGAAMPSQGELNLDGLEYAWAPSVLQLNFFASGSMALSGGTLVVVDTTLVLHPLSMDLRANSLAVARTRAKIDVWNENETKFSGGGRCIECWDRTLLSQYGVPNHFLMAHLQSDAGKARIDGVSSVQCPQSMDLPMHGMAIRELSFVGGRRERSSAILTGMGTQATAIRLDPSPADPPEGPTPP